MLERIRAIIKQYPDRAAFFTLIGQYYPPGSYEYQKVEDAYKFSKDAFREVFRDGGERYFEHLRAVAIILIVYLRVHDWEVICAALLHDIVEDIKEWPHERVVEVFGQEIAELVWWVTKPKVSDFGGDKVRRNRFYHDRLQRAPRKSIMIKLVDRLHNLLTLWETSEEKRARKIVETENFFLILAEREIILIHELEACLDELRSVPPEVKEKGQP